MNKIHTALLVISLIVAICFPAAHQGVLAQDMATTTDSTTTDSTATSKPPIIQYDTLAIITEPKGAKIEKNFDKLRDYTSYDPITKTWSAIEDFKTVDMLSDTTQEHAEDYLYYSFWAYDPVTRQWKRVDIRSYGYKRPEEIADTTEQKPKKPFEFWKNFGMSFALGSGGTYYSNTTNDLNLMVRKGQNEFFFQTRNPIDRIQGKAYRIRWFSDTYARIIGIQRIGVVYDNNSLEEIKDKTVQFTGWGFNLPTITLDLHYTFFNKLRVGIGSNLAINYLKSLSIEKMTYTIEKPWFYQVKWFGTVAYKVFRRRLHTVLVNTQIGMVYDLGNEPIKNFTKIINNTFCVSLGVAHERRLNDFFSFFYRLSGEYKRYVNKTEFAPQVALVTLLQPALNLEAGFTINFGRQKPLPIDETLPPTEGDALGSVPPAASTEGGEPTGTSELATPQPTEVGEATPTSEVPTPQPTEALPTSPTPPIQEARP